MSMQVIIKGLNDSQLLTGEERKTLEGAKESRAFLNGLARVFENKTRLYLNACKSEVKKALASEKIPQGKIDALILERTMDAALAVFLNSEKFSAFASLILLMRSKAEDLLTSLALKAPDGDPSLNGVVEKVLVSYVARKRIFQTVDTAALSSICEELGEEDSLDFPKYLFTAFIIENTLSRAIKRELADKKGSTPPELLAAQAANDSASVYGCLSNTIFYLGNLIRAEALSKETKDRYFHHLESPDTHLRFVQEIAAGCLSEMQAAPSQQLVASSLQKVVASKTTSVCLPALSLIGIPISLDMKTLSQEVEKIQTAIDNLREKQASYEKLVAEEKSKAHAKIDQWRASIPEREVVWGLKLSGNF